MGGLHAVCGCDVWLLHAARTRDIFPRRLDTLKATKTFKLFFAFCTGFGSPVLHPGAKESLRVPRPVVYVKTMSPKAAKDAVDKAAEGKRGVSSPNSKNPRVTDMSRGGITDETTCQVPGCEVTLAALKVYNQRCRVCAEHLISGEVDFQGIVRRFCQQCARFHDVTEFDGSKRSCRVRLERHKMQRQKRKRTTAEPSESGGSKVPLLGNYERTSLPLKDSWGALPQQDQGVGKHDHLLRHWQESLNSSGMPMNLDSAMSGYQRPHEDEWEVPAAAKRGSHPGQPSGFKDKDPGTFMDGLLSKLHANGQGMSEGNGHGGHGGNSWDMSWMNMAAPQGYGPNITPLPSDWSMSAKQTTEQSMWGTDNGNAAFDPTVPISTMGFRNVQEAIDGLPFQASSNFPDAYSSFGSLPAVDKQQPEQGNFDAKGKAPGKDGFMDSIMRSLHESGEEGRAAPGGMLSYEDGVHGMAFNGSTHSSYSQWPSAAGHGFPPAEGGEVHAQHGQPWHHYGRF